VYDRALWDQLIALSNGGINTPKAIEVPETAMEMREQAGRMTQPWAMSLTLKAGHDILYTSSDFNQLDFAVI
jgi:hypothetical protein